MGARGSAAGMAAQGGLDMKGATDMLNQAMLAEHVAYTALMAGERAVLCCAVLHAVLRCAVLCSRRQQGCNCASWVSALCGWPPGEASLQAGIGPCRLAADTFRVAHFPLQKIKLIAGSWPYFPQVDQLVAAGQRCLAQMT